MDDFRESFKSNKSNARNKFYKLRNKIKGFAIIQKNHLSKHVWSDIYAYFEYIIPNILTSKNKEMREYFYKNIQSLINDEDINVLRNNLISFNDNIKKYDSYINTCELYRLKKHQDSKETIKFFSDKSKEKGVMKVVKSFLLFIDNYGKSILNFLEIIVLILIIWFAIKNKGINISF